MAYVAAAGIAMRNICGPMTWEAVSHRLMPSANDASHWPVLMADRQPR